MGYINITIASDNLQNYKLHFYNTFCSQICLPLLYCLLRTQVPHHTIQHGILLSIVSMRWKCSYSCSLELSNTVEKYVLCDGGYLIAANLQVGQEYKFSVFAVDGVGNIGNPAVYKWIFGKSLQCTSHMKYLFIPPPPPPPLPNSTAH